MTFKRGQKHPANGKHPNSKANLKKGGTNKVKEQPPEILLDMRAVYRGDTIESPTPGQQLIQTLFADNPKEFLQRLSREEALFKQGKGTGYTARGDVPILADGADEGTERVKDLIEKLLGEWEEKA